MSEVAGNNRVENTEAKTETKEIKSASTPDKAKEGENLDKEQARKILSLAKKLSETADDLEDLKSVPLNPELEDSLLAEKSSEQLAIVKDIFAFLRSNGKANEMDVKYGDKFVHRIYDQLPTNPDNVSIKMEGGGFTINWQANTFPNNLGYTSVSIDPETSKITYTSTEMTLD